MSLEFVYTSLRCCSLILVLGFAGLELGILKKINFMLLIQLEQSVKYLDTTLQYNTTTVPKITRTTSLVGKILVNLQNKEGDTRFTPAF